MAEIPEQIASLLIPMIGRPLLMPNVTVAEIVNWKTPQEAAGAPHWLLGTVDWRGVSLPVISLELMNDSGIDDADSGHRLLVMNAQGTAKVPFYGIAVQGIPRLVRVFPEELGDQDDAVNDLAYDLMVMVSGERAVIPDLLRVEEELNTIIG